MVKKYKNVKRNSSFKNKHSVKLTIRLFKLFFLVKHKRRLFAVFMQLFFYRTTKRQKKPHRRSQEVKKILLNAETTMVIKEFNILIE